MALATGSAPVTKALIAINVVVYLIGASQAGGLTNPQAGIYVRGTLYRHAVLFGPYVAGGGWYRLVTAMFLHANLIHIGFNMLALWWIGKPVEQYLGRARYIGLYFVSGLAGSAGALLWSPLIPSLGASGAVFGVLAAMMILEWQITGRLAGTAMTWIAINLVLDFAYNGVGGNISIGAHLGGVVGGILITLGYAHWRGGRAQYGQLGLGGVVGLAVVAAGSVALAYLKVRGYA
jgi:membrane associated rhomboid family serine protease